MAQHDVAIIVQARMGSTRLPGKVLLDLCGVPMLVYQMDRLEQWAVQATAFTSLSLTVALANTPEDKATLAPALWRHGFPCSTYPCDPDDVLARYEHHIIKTLPDVPYIVRLTGDCPLFDPHILTLAWQMRRDDDYDYYAPAAEWPDGMDFEILKRETLLTAAQEATDPVDREHVTPYIWKRPERFHCGTLPCPYPLGEEKWSVDTEKDYAFVRAVVREMQRRSLGYLYGWRDVWAVAREMAWRPQGERNGAYLHQIGSTKTWDEERYGAQSRTE